MLDERGDDMSAFGRCAMADAIHALVRAFIVALLFSEAGGLLLSCCCCAFGSATSNDVMAKPW